MGGKKKRKLNPSEEQTCSIKWRAENVKLVSDAAFSLQIPEQSLQNTGNPCTEFSLQSGHTAVC